MSLLFWWSLLFAQPAQPPSALLTTPQVNQLCGRLTELMDAEGVAIPDLNARRHR